MYYLINQIKYYKFIPNNNIIQQNKINLKKEIEF